MRNRVKYLVAECRRRSAKKGLSFNLDQYIPELQARLDMGACELSGIPFKQTMGPTTYDSPSLDRINPSEGYLYGNVRIVCYAMNCALGNWGEEALLTILEGWQRRRSE
jgi:hypothetical protein